MARASTTSEQEIAGAAAERVSRRALVGLAIVVVYAVIVAFHAAPSWFGQPDAITRGVFAQRWNLFAPDPPSANLTTFVLVRYRSGSALRVTEPLDLSRSVRNDARSHRSVAPKLVRVVTKLNVAFEAHAFDRARAVVRGRDRRTATHAPPAHLEAYRRLLSAAARSIVPPGAEVVSVRGVLVRTPVNTFDDRGDAAAEVRLRILDPDVPPAPLSVDVLRDVRDDLEPRTMLIFDSGWMAYAPDVVDLEVALP